MKQLLTILFRYLVAIVSKQNLIESAQKALSIVETFKEIVSKEYDLEDKIFVLQKEINQDFPVFFRNTFGLELKTYLSEKQTASFKKHSDWYYLEMAAATLRSEYPEIGITESYIIILLCYNQKKVDSVIEG